MTFITHGFRVSVVSEVRKRVRDLGSPLHFMLKDLHQLSVLVCYTERVYNAQNFFLSISMCSHVCQKIPSTLFIPLRARSCSQIIGIYSLYINVRETRKDNLIIYFLVKGVFPSFIGNLSRILTLLLLLSGFLTPKHFFKCDFPILRLLEYLKNVIPETRLALCT